MCVLFPQLALRDPLLYGDYRTALQPEQPRIYEDIQDYQAAKGLFDEILEEYNENHKPMNLVLFDNALEHLTRVHRLACPLHISPEYTGQLVLYTSHQSTQVSLSFTHLTRVHRSACPLHISPEYTGQLVLYTSHQSTQVSLSFTHLTRVHRSACPLHTSPEYTGQLVLYTPHQSTQVSLSFTHLTRVHRLSYCVVRIKNFSSYIRCAITCIYMYMYISEKEWCFIQKVSLRIRCICYVALSCLFV